MTNKNLHVDTTAVARCRTTIASAQQVIGTAGTELADARGGMSAFGTLPGLRPITKAVTALVGTLGTQVAAADWLLGQIETTLGGHQSTVERAENTNVDSAAQVKDQEGDQNADN